MILFEQHFDRPLAGEHALGQNFRRTGLPGGRHRQRGLADEHRDVSEERLQHPPDPNGDSVLLFTDQGNLIRARLSSAGYRELSRVHLLDPTYPFNGRNVVWPPCYAHRHVFARNDKELICALLAAEP